MQIKQFLGSLSCLCLLLIALIVLLVVLIDSNYESFGLNQGVLYLASYVPLVILLLFVIFALSIVFDPEFKA